MKKIGFLLGVLICFCAVLFVGGGCRKNQNGYSRYEIVAEYVPETKTLRGTMKVTFENFTNNELDILKASNILMDDFRSGKLGKLTLEFPSVSE